MMKAIHNSFNIEKVIVYNYISDNTNLHLQLLADY